MTLDPDHYEAYYTDKLWNLIPAVYRSLDTDQFDHDGPLREMVNRIGAQAAVLRRGIDRMWEDQSIETCDDWVIPYIGDLLATNLVANLDSRGRRLDVANTINYRRRKGTLAVLEQIAADVTGWDARVVEFFRRLGRTRHGLDPATLRPAAPGDEVARLQRAEGLVGPLTRTPAGGTAALCNVYGATKAHSPFDEFSHTADLRRGRGRVGWHDIPRLGVFLWRLRSYEVGPTTPVAVRGCDGWYTFDPTGRDVPLFARAARTSEAYGDNWVSPVEGQLPGRISQPLFDAQLPAPASPPPCAPSTPGFRLYPDSLAVFATAAPAAGDDPLPVGQLRVRPVRGRFHSAARPGSVTYHYGFSSEIGAGPYDRRPGRRQPPQPAPARSVQGGGTALGQANAVPAAGTLTIQDSLTYDLPGDRPTNVSVTGALTVRAESQQRPLIRLAPPAGTAPPDSPPAAWVFTGAGDCCLVLDGLWVSGGDVILRGEFSCVTITCCTLDPGSAAPPLAPPSAPASPPARFALSADGRELVPCRLWIEAKVATLTIERSITGPIRTRTRGRDRGEVETLKVSDSIIQAIPTGETSPPWSPPSGPPGSPPDGGAEASGDAALFLDDGEVQLSRCTVLGPVVVHRLQASECILHDVARVDDMQQGCVRFSAWADGGGTRRSVLPRQYESVRVPPAAPLFESTDFGQPGYAQLLATADAAVLPGDSASDSSGAAADTILAGAQDGSEMGAFAREQNPIKERGLLIKYQEFMPAGLVPVVIYVT